MRTRLRLAELLQCLRAFGTKFALVAFAFLLTLSSEQPAQGGDDLWPLVKKAEKATWGILTEVIDGDEDRLLVIDVTWDANGRNKRGAALLRLLDRGGRHSCGTTHLHVGDRGLFLFRSAVDGSGEFAAVDGWLLTGGFVPAEADARTRSSFAHLFASKLVAPAADTDAVTSGAETSVAAESVLESLAMSEPTLKSMALGWLKQHPIELTATQRRTMESHFLEETNPIVCRSYLELFLLKNWALAGERCAEIVINGQDSELIEIAVTYLEHHGTNDCHARLLLEYPRATVERRVVLMQAYARLGLEEAAPWWDEALLSDDPREQYAAIQTMALAAPEGSEEIYIELLRSENTQVRKQALRGLATLGTEGARNAILQILESADEDDSVGRLARNILKNPRRYSRVRTNLR